MAIKGFLDSCEGGYVRGWALDTWFPNRPLRIDVLLDGRLIACGLANRHRADLEQTVPGGACAFEIEASVPDTASLSVRAGRKVLPVSGGFRSGISPPRSTARSAARFEKRAPSHDNAVDLFAGSWAGDPLVSPADGRIERLVATWGSGGRLDGMRVLELGPLEGLHTVLLERLGADVLAIEANADAFLKCLIVKEIAGLTRARFMLGDFVAYLANAPERFDIVLCSGVLYHMADPISLIEMIGKVTDRCFVWSHVYDENRYSGPARSLCRDARYPDFDLWALDYGASAAGNRFWGGNRQRAVWMRKDHMFAVFRAAGLATITDFGDGMTGGHAATCFAASR